MSNPTGEGSKVAQGASQPPPGKWGIPEELAADRMGQGPIYIGWFLLILGTFLILVAALIHWRRLKLLEQGEIFSRSRWSLGLVVAFLLFGLGFFALVSHFFMF